MSTFGGLLFLPNIIASVLFVSFSFRIAFSLRSGSEITKDICNHLFSNFTFLYYGARRQRRRRAYWGSLFRIFVIFVILISSLRWRYCGLIQVRVTFSVSWNDTIFLPSLRRRRAIRFLFTFFRLDRLMVNDRRFAIFSSLLCFFRNSFFLIFLRAVRCVERYFYRVFRGRASMWISAMKIRRISKRFCRHRAFLLTMFLGCKDAIRVFLHLCAD